MDFVDGIEWIELEAWNPGIPLRVVVDGRDKENECFEIGRCLTLADKRMKPATRKLATLMHNVCTRGDR